METQKLPFEITPQVKRYLEDIVYLQKEWLANEDMLFMIEEEIPGETSTPRMWGNNENFWGYLEKQKVLKDLYMFDTEDLARIIKKNHPIQQIAIARIHGNEKSPVEKFFAQSETWKEDLGKIMEASVERLRSDTHEKPYILLKIFDLKPIEKLLESIKPSKENVQHSMEIERGEVRSIKLPPNTRWQDITMRFLDKDNIEITTKDFARTANFKEVGFEDKKTKRPNLQWKFLQLLAMQKGELRWETDLDTSVKERDRFKKKVQILSDTLENYFQIKEPLFYSYRKEKAYRIKINLIRPSDYQESAQQQKDKIGSEVKEYLDKNAPSVYEEPNKYDDNY